MQRLARPDPNQLASAATTSMKDHDVVAGVSSALAESASSRQMNGMTLPSLSRSSIQNCGRTCDHGWDVPPVVPGHLQSFTARAMKDESPSVGFGLARHGVVAGVRWLPLRSGHISAKPLNELIEVGKDSRFAGLDISDGGADGLVLFSGPYAKQECAVPIWRHV